MNTPESLSLSPDEVNEPTGTVLRLVSEGYRVLAELHDAIALAAPEPAAAHEHVTRATRELASIQKLFERRGRGDR